MLLQGLVITCVGMGGVFLFLALLVVATSYSSSLIRRFEEKTTSENPQ